MQFQHIDRSDPEIAYAAIKNISGGTLSAGAAAFYDAATADGISVSAGTAINKYLFAGIVASALSNSSYGRAQVYGVCSAYIGLGSSTVSVAAGAQLDSVTSATYLSKYTSQTIIGSSAAYTVENPWNFVTNMAAFDSAAAMSNTPQLHTVFVRAL